MNEFIYLASKSPRRRELLSQIGVNHQVIDVDVPEIREQNELAKDYVIRLAAQKALAGEAMIRKQALMAAPVLGSDTIVLLQGQKNLEVVLEKPKDKADFIHTFNKLSGREHLVLTAVAMAENGRLETVLSTTRVKFRVISAEEIDKYWQTGEPQDKAGGYGIQGYGAVFVEQIQGSYSGVMGLPLAEVATLLTQYNVSMWQSA